ncbi:hypothetical protein WJX73_006602 [Symbiochloris irregularis]|uniref:non-specific serine/threonine protein kinase n=1 Tax=Symbiochloris irregularis TaxID=706552 RepID=A0AAW1P1R5_9CHLO
MGSPQDSANTGETSADHSPQQSGSRGGNNPHGTTAEFFLSNYRLGKTLGIGSFGKVKIAEHVQTGHKVAIKILNYKKIRQQDMEEKVRREIKILRLFMHPHIIRLYEVVETATDIYVVMEYVKAGELFDYIVEKGRLLEDEARNFFQQIISGIEYCHRNMVVHRDLKPENLLLDAKLHVKIADFGLSNVMRDGHFLKTSCGSPNYAAPEVISGRLYAGPEVDVWSCGVILYALLCGSLPFDDENIPNLFKKIKGGIYNLPSHLSPGARDLIPRMLLVDPMQRITLPEIRQHPWFTLHLPRYLAVMQADTAATTTLIDEELVAETAALGFDRDYVLASLRRRQHNKATVAYYLIADNRRPSSSYLRAELTEAHDAHHQYPSGMMNPPQQPSGRHGPGGTGTHNTTGMMPQQRLVAERKWRLGWPSRSHPATLMQDLLRALQAHNCAWKKVAPFCLKCRMVLPPPTAMRAHSLTLPPPSSRELPAQSSREVPENGQSEELDNDVHMGGSDSLDSSTHGQDSNASGQLAELNTKPRVLKFEVQLYKSKDGEYCIDVQRVQGELFLFMDVCGSILSSLRT